MRKGSWFGLLGRSLAHELAAVCCALGAVACVDTESGCPEPNTYRVFVDTRSAPGAACTLTLAGARGEASYEYPTTRVCGDDESRPPCTPTPGSPTPNSCRVWSCGLKLEFSGARGAALIDQLGSTELELTARCDGQVLETQSVEPFVSCY